MAEFPRDRQHQPRDPQRGPAPLNKVISRRTFLRRAAAAALLAAAGCRPETPPGTPEPASTTALTRAPTATPAPAPTSTPPAAPTVAPTPTPASTPTVAPTVARVSPPRARVALAQAAGYDRRLVRQQVQAMLDGLGGLGDVISAGDRVALKVNLTGGHYFDPPAGLSATESHMTHPEVVRALGELVRDAGAGELFIVEAAYDKESFSSFGYEEVAEALDATLIDLNEPRPYNDFASTPVGEGWFIYDSFTFNHILEEVDAFISVAKMKCHCRCGVTHSMKNLVGLAPVGFYRLNQGDWWRSALHGVGNETKARLPRVILDLNRARPIHLALIDGVKTAEGGEAPRGSFAPVSPGVLFAGKDPVATDAVATAAMGFDPTVNYPAVPFVNGDNYLNLAYDLGLGTNRLEEIEVVGAAIDDVRSEFAPCWSEMGALIGEPFA